MRIKTLYYTVGRIDPNLYFEENVRFGPTQAISAFIPDNSTAVILDNRGP